MTRDCQPADARRTAPPGVRDPGDQADQQGQRHHAEHDPQPQQVLAPLGR